MAKLIFNFIVTGSVLVSLALYTENCIADNSIQPPSDIATDGLPGFFNVGIPYAAHRQLNIAGTGHYGFIESVGPISGFHHELGGTVSVGGVIFPWFSTALLFDGKYQKHPADNEGADKSIIGVPILKFRGGAPVGRGLILGGELEARIPGNNAPSLQFKATTLTTRFLATILSLAPFYFGVTLGFVWDNSEHSAPAHESIRPGDIVALDVASYNAVVFGLAMAWHVNRMRFIFEADSLKYLSANVPFKLSPTRFTIGARYAATDTLQFDLYTETIAGKRPNLETQKFFLPIRPRFSVFAGLRVTLGANAQKTSESTIQQLTIPDKKTAPPPEAEKPPTGTVEGQIWDSENLPIADATIVVRTADGIEIPGRTDKEGAYRIPDVPVGTATVTVSAEYFDTVSFSVDVTENKTVSTPPTVLIQAEVGSQIRGLVRDVNGNPLNAAITVLPGKYKTKTDNDGFFEVDVVPGKYTVEINTPGFIRQKRTVAVDENSVVILNVDLSAKN